MENYRSYTIFTACACINNGKPNATAGWGAVLINPEGNILQLAEPIPWEEQQTSYRAALCAIPRAIQRITKPAIISVFLNTKTIVDNYLDDLDSWPVNGWRRKTGNVSHRDVWESILQDRIRHQMALHYLGPTDSGSESKLARYLAVEGAKRKTICLRS